MQSLQVMSLCVNPVLPSMPPMMPPPTEWQTSVPSDSKWESGSLGSSPRQPMVAAAVLANWEGNVGGDEGGDPRRDVTGWDGGERPSDGNPGS